MISINNLCKEFNSIYIFKDINISIPTGKVVHIKGPNGSGKSILLKMITGFSAPSSGTIQIDDLIIRKDIDFIPNAGIFINAPEFAANWTGLKNLKYIASINNISSDNDIINLCKKVNLTLEDLNKKYRHYSQGMKQKLRIVQALLDNPKYLILDEPFDTLDDASRKLVVDLISEYRLKNPDVTLIYTSHDQSVSIYSDICLLINDMNLVAC